MNRFLLLLFVTISISPANAQKKDAKIVAVFYSKKGNWSPSRTHFEKMLKSNSISFERISAHDILEKKVLSKKKYDFLYIPGGKSWEYLDELGHQGAKEIRHYVMAGGFYIGICAGAFYAMSHRLGGYDFKNKKPIDRVIPYGIGLLDGVAYDGSSMNDSVFKRGMVDIDILGDASDKPYEMLLLEGPGIRVTNEEQKTKALKILGYFSQSNEVAIVEFNYGQGRVFLSSPHLEIEESRLYFGIPYRDKESDWSLLMNFINAN